MWEEFKKFAFRGNVLDMAVGVIIGTAFGKIVTSLVNDIFMPVIGNLLGGSNMSGLKLVLSPAEIVDGVVVKEEAALLYGSFLQNVIDFFLIAICIFFFVKVINKLTAKKEAQAEATAPEAPASPTVEELLTDIRDLLQQK
ncbi:MAG: large-conductance mechanosensitive channel protein MscL [Peptococcaceae bacterium]|jgi:large conductance mechanosensitive channel|nr:large-conductance mechanosensitive channel protein MscL [Peptococcaceae bacterium]